MNTLRKEPSLITLLLLTPLASISAVLFTPALPEIARAKIPGLKCAGTADDYPISDRLCVRAAILWTARK